MEANERSNEEFVPLRDRLGCTVKEACVATGLKATKVYELIAAGAIESTKVGKRRIILVRSIIRLIEGNPAETCGSNDAP